MMTSERGNLTIEEEEEAIKEGRPGVEVLRLAPTSRHCCEVALYD